MKIEYLDLFFGFFNILLGVLSFMVSVGRLKTAKELTLKQKLFFKVIGVVLVLGGMFKIMSGYGPISR